MILDPTIPELAAWIDTSSIHVYAPTPIIFVCGGKRDLAEPVALSFRDAYLRICEKGDLKKYTSILAEDLNAFFPNGDYKDILSFESDLAQIVEVILLFSESEGSYAELGAFAMLDEIAKRLLVAIDDKNYSSKSFITLGPLRRLINTYGDNAVYVLNKDLLNVENINELHKLNYIAFEKMLAVAVKNHQSTRRQKSTFDKHRDGHIIKLIVGLLQMYGALTLDEIDVYLFQLDVVASREKIASYLLCATFCDWIISEKIGSETYFAAVPTSRIAIDYKFKPDSPIKDKMRWRFDVAAYWKASDMARSQAIKIAVSKGA